MEFVPGLGDGFGEAGVPDEVVVVRREAGKVAVAFAQALEQIRGEQGAFGADSGEVGALGHVLSGEVEVRAEDVGGEERPTR